MKLKLFICLFLTFGCKGSQSQNPNVEYSAINSLFSVKEVKKLLTDYFGTERCYTLIPHNKDLNISLYEVVSFSKKVKPNYISNTCKTSDLSVFYYREKDTFYFQIFETDGGKHDYGDYPLINSSHSIYFKMELNNFGVKNIMKSVVVFN